MTIQELHDDYLYKIRRAKNKLKKAFSKSRRRYIVTYTQEIFSYHNRPEQRTEIVIGDLYEWFNNKSQNGLIVIQFAILL